MTDEPSPARVLHFETLDSTNEEAHRQLAAGVRLPVWIVAGEQTRGRGRGGRAWISPKGNLYATYLAVTPLGAAVATQLSFVAALAAHEAAAHCLPAVEASKLRLKWPNDVMLGDAKIAGILLESLRAPDGRLAVILGIGINVASAPEGMGRPVASLGLSCADTQTVFDALSRALSRFIALWDEGRAFETIRSLWLDRAYALQQAVSVHLNGSLIRGKFCGVDPAGALQLETAPGVVLTVTAGDIYPDGSQ